MNKKNMTMLVDGTCLYKIVFEGVKSMPLQNENLHAVWGFLKSLRGKLQAIQNERHDYPCFIKNMIVFWDGKESGNLRRAIHPKYKERRNRYFEGIDPYYQQKNLVIELLSYLGIDSFIGDETETDDCIAYYIHNNPNDKFLILTSDRDYLQLLSENVYYMDLERLTNRQVIKQLGLEKSEEKIQMLAMKLPYVSINPIYTPKNFTTYFNYNYQNTLLRKTILGDESDCIDGAVGVGIKTLEGVAPFFIYEKMNKEELLVEVNNSMLKKPSTKTKKLLDFLNDDEIFNHTYNLMNLQDKEKLFITEACKLRLDELSLSQQNKVLFYKNENLKGKFINKLKQFPIIIREINSDRDIMDISGFTLPFLPLSNYKK